jgi:hypothetical protein
MRLIRRRGTGPQTEHRDHTDRGDDRQGPQPGRNTGFYSSLEHRCSPWSVKVSSKRKQFRAAVRRGPQSGYSVQIKLYATGKSQAAECSLIAPALGRVSWLCQRMDCALPFEPDGRCG